MAAAVEWVTAPAMATVTEITATAHEKDSPSQMMRVRVRVPFGAVAQLGER